MNWLDAAIAAVAPRTGLDRARARLALDQVRDYDAARPSRRQDSWRRTNGGPRVEVMKGAEPVRRAVRDLLRNNGYAQRAHRTLVSSTVGTGIVGTPMTDGGALTTRKNRDAWKRWVDGCDFDRHHDLYGLQNMLARSMFESGEALLRFRRVSFDASVKVPPVRVQVLEPDYVATQKYENLTQAGGYIDRGIEYDAQGIKVALWLWPDHPGNLTPYIRTKFVPERVPIGEVEQVYEMLRPGQDRGISIFAGAVMPMKDLADYFEAEAMRKRIEACLALFITSPETMGSPALGVATGGAAQDDLGNNLGRLVPGMMTRLKPGEDISPGPVAPVGDMTPFVRQQQLLAAAAGGVMFEHMTGDFSNMNYSTYRAASFDYGRQIEQLQWLTLSPRMLTPLASRFNDAARAAQLLGAADVAIRWTPPRPITTLDPVKDETANQMAMRNGSVAPSQVAEARGNSYPELLDQIAVDLAAADKIGVAFDSDPRKVLKGTNAGILVDDTAATGKPEVTPNATT